MGLKSHDGSRYHECRVNATPSPAVRGQRSHRAEAPHSGRAGRRRLENWSPPGSRPPSQAPPAPLGLPHDGLPLLPQPGALLVAAHPETAARSLLADDPPADPAARLDAVVTAFTTLIIKTEAEQRTMLRLSLERRPGRRAGLPLRQGSAIAWIAEALEPLRGQLRTRAARARAGHPQRGRHRSPRLADRRRRTDPGAGGRVDAVVRTGAAQDRPGLRPSGASDVNVRCRVVSNQVR